MSDNLEAIPTEEPLTKASRASASNNDALRRSPKVFILHTPCANPWKSGNNT